VYLSFLSSKAVESVAKLMEDKELVATNSAVQKAPVALGKITGTAFQNR
jgi:hypothetical protein